MKTLEEQLRDYHPESKEEQQAKEAFLEKWEELGDAFFTRTDEGHITASSMILNPARNKMLMIHHNIYKAFGWTGGHADGEKDLLKKAEEEACEETGIRKFYPVDQEILSIDILPVPPHEKHGKSVKAHMHYNVTYGIIAPEKQELRVKPDENSAVIWVPLEGWEEKCTEAHMIPIYKKLIERIEKKMQEKEALYPELPKRLLPWFLEHKRDLPWRKDRDPYHIWLSEIMLQQTRVEAVKGYYARFLEELPTIKALAEAPEDQILKLWEGLGYYSRVRNLQKGAKVVMDEFGGSFPKSYQEIASLPGIGPYTAGAIGSICFNLKTPAVDGNVLRVVSRLTDQYRDILAPDTKKDMTHLLEEVYPEGEHAYLFNQSMMEIGATVCVPNGAPKCEVCPLEECCLARIRNTWSDLPKKEPKKKRKIEEKTVFLLKAGDKTAVEKRGSKGLLAGLWQLPNTEGTLSAQEALKQAKAWDVHPKELVKEQKGKHIFSHIEWHMTCFEIICEEESDRFVWADPKKMEEEIALPSAFKVFH